MRGQWPTKRKRRESGVVAGVLAILTIITATVLYLLDHSFESLSTAVVGVVASLTFGLTALPRLQAVCMLWIFVTATFLYGAIVVIDYFFLISR
jgi:hypothetical protein